MANKIANPSYDQIPHIVINHPETTPEHKEIMRALFKVLKDESKPIIYTNEKLAEHCRISLRTIERKITELSKMGFISLTGRGYNRRISLGLLFNNPANLAVKKLNNSAKFANTTAKSDIHNRQFGGDYNPYTNPYTKEKLSFKTLNHYEKKELEFCAERKVPLAHDFKYLQPLLDEIIKNEKTSTIT